MSHSEFLLSDIFASDFSPGPVPKHRRVAEEGSPATAAPSDVAESSRRVGGAGSQSPEEIPVGEPICNVLPPRGQARLHLAA